MGRLTFEALREEVHRFDRSIHTLSIAIRQRLCCSAAMRMLQCFQGECTNCDHFQERDYVWEVILSVCSQLRRIDDPAAGANRAMKRRST